MKGIRHSYAAGDEALAPAHEYGEFRGHGASMSIGQMAAQMQMKSGQRKRFQKGTGPAILSAPATTQMKPQAHFGGNYGSPYGGAKKQHSLPKVAAPTKKPGAKLPPPKLPGRGAGPTPLAAPTKSQLKPMGHVGGDSKKKAQAALYKAKAPGKKVDKKKGSAKAGKPDASKGWEQLKGSIAEQGKAAGGRGVSAAGVIMQGAKALVMSNGVGAVAGQGGGDK